VVWLDSGIDSALGCCAWSDVGQIMVWGWWVWCWGVDWKEGGSVGDVVIERGGCLRVLCVVVDGCSGLWRGFFSGMVSAGRDCGFVFDGFWGFRIGP